MSAKIVTSLALNLILAALYFFSGKLGLSLAFFHPSATPVWPPTGLSLAAILLFGYRVGPAIWLGAYLVNLTTTGDIPSSAGIAVGNTLEALVGAYMLRRFARGANSFDRVQDVFKFIALAAMASTVVSATFGVTSLCLRGLGRWEQYASIWATWWLGDMTSDLIVAPFFVIWGAKPFPKMKPHQVLEAALLLALAILVSQAAFGSWSPFKVKNYPLEYLGIPILLWASFRFGQRGAAGAAFLMSGMAVWGTLGGFGPFAVEDRNMSLLLLQAFAGTITISALILAAVVSERKLATEALARHVEELVRSNEELEKFAYVASHDLQEPLRKIITFSDRLKESDVQGLGEASRHSLERIEQSAWRMKELIEDLLAFSRVNSQEEPFEAVDMADVMREVLGDLEGRIAQTGAKIEAGPLAKVRGSRLQMRLLLQNLIGNALKFSKKGEAPYIQIEGRPVNRNGEPFVEIVVRDHGIGFEQKYVDRMFQPFQRLHHGKEYEGTGMGLAICQKIVQRHGGEISAKGEVGRGATFAVKLPMMK